LCTLFIYFLDHKVLPLYGMIAIAIVVFGIIAVVILVVAVVSFFICRKRNSNGGMCVCMYIYYVYIIE